MTSPEHITPTQPDARPLITLTGEDLTRQQVAQVSRGEARVTISEGAAERVRRARQCVEDAVARGDVVYGVNTGFGSNADIVIDDLKAAERLQRNLILTHAVCVGEPLPIPLVRAMMVIRVNTLIKGYSGLRLRVIERLVDMLNAGLIPVIPSKGSVGASGDLAPLSHMALPLLGEGEVFYQGERLPAQEALGALPQLAHLPVEERGFELSYKEGLALNNGTAQMAASLALVLDKLSHLTKLAELEYLIIHSGGRGQQWRYEVIYRGEGQENERFLLGLIGTANLSDDGNRGAQNGDRGSENSERGISGAPQGHSRGRGGSPPEKPRKPSNHKPSSTHAAETAENTQPEGDENAA